MSSRPKNGKKPPLKQGTLFSFFSKKPSTPPSAVGTPETLKKQEQRSNAATTTTTTPTTLPSPSSLTKDSPLSSSSSTHSTAKNSTNKASKPSPERNEDWKKVTVGSRISVYWPDDDQYYDATVAKQKNKNTSNFYLKYDDDQTEWIDLQHEQFRFLKMKTDKTTKRTTSQKVDAAPKPKRRRIESDDDDDDDEEFELQDEQKEDEDDCSVYDPKGADHDEDDEDVQWMVTDDEDECEVVKKKSTKKAIKVTHHHQQHKPSSPSSAATKTPLLQFANTVSPQTTSTSPSSPSNDSHSSRPSRKALKSAFDTNTPESTTVGEKGGQALSYTKGAVNPRGSHVHNHLKFLQNPKDLSGRKPNDPNYNPRTLKVVHSEWEAHCGKMTDAVKQWWDLKSQYFDTVLLFKTGKFYEMFHMDADVGVDVLGLIYMKGHVAHAGFPEIRYGFMSSKLVKAGYKVARVEQTETPEMLKERKQKKKGGKTPKVVNREVCSIMSLGTRTFCFLDDSDGLTLEEGGDSGGIGPLLAIREVLKDEDQDTDASMDADSVRPVCEYGVTIVDAVRGTVTIGQFADDVLRSKMNTLLTTFSPSEILLQGGENGASPTLRSLIRTTQNSSRTVSRTENIGDTEMFPKSTALDSEVRSMMERKGPNVRPWDVDETLEELHRRGYYPRASRKQKGECFSVTRWPTILRAAVEGNANLALSSFGAALFYLQRNLIDSEVLSMGIVKAYIPPAASAVPSQTDGLTMGHTQQESDLTEGPSSVSEQASVMEGDVPSSQTTTKKSIDFDGMDVVNDEDQISSMSLDGTTLHNLEILTNSIDHKVAGSLWSKINYTKTPHGARMLRAWLLRPLFRKADIDRRLDAVEELVSGAGAVALTEAQTVLSKIGDLERLLSRVHSMSGTQLPGSPESETQSFHPSDRAILYEGATYTKRKVGDFSKLLHGLRHACRIPEVFGDIDLQSGLLCKVVKLTENGGCFPALSEHLDWYFDNFDCDKAAKGMFEPPRGVDEPFDDAIETIERIKAELEDYKKEMCNELAPKHVAKSSWKYINVKPEAKDKYLIELPASVRVPDDFIVKGKRGSGQKQVNKYRTTVVAKLVYELEAALEIQKARKARGMQLIFAKFDSQRSLWAAAAQATAMLDALGSLAQTSSKSGFARAKILDCPPDVEPSLKIIQGRHPCVETSVNSSDFIPNDLILGATRDKNSDRVLLLSGPNMGGKSTLLRQTCLIAIMAQIGSFVPAEECELTPIDCIYTRLGASDRILLGQSTFFVELAETAAALRGATRRSLVIMDELGRGTSTFDGTAIASAAVKHLVERNKCISLFATHYHSLLDEWKDEPNVRLGHMQCLVDDKNAEDPESDADGSIAFLYTLGVGTCPKSFGINVARLASLPSEVLAKAKRVSEEFEEEMSINGKLPLSRSSSLKISKREIVAAIENGDWDQLRRLWEETQEQ